jgi:hypothetical protein
MTREEFLLTLRTADDAFDDDPMSSYAQKIADYDADRRVLIQGQRAEIERLKAELTISQSETDSVTHAYQLLAEAYERKQAECTQIQAKLATAKGEEC